MIRAILTGRKITPFAGPDSFDAADTDPPTRISPPATGRKPRGTRTAQISVNQALEETLPT